MSFDRNNLERLKQLRRKLPKPLPSPEKGPKRTIKEQKFQHPIETLDDPQKLFKELIDVSPDGTVPSHLIDRLKEIEERHSRIKQPKDLPSEVDHLHRNASQSSSHNKKLTVRERSKLPNPNNEDALYIDFHKLLLEDEDL